MADHLMWHTHGVKKGKKRQQCQGIQCKGAWGGPKLPLVQAVGIKFDKCARLLLQALCTCSCIRRDNSAFNSPANTFSMTAVPSPHVLMHPA